MAITEESEMKPAWREMTRREAIDLVRYAGPVEKKGLELRRAIRQMQKKFLVDNNAYPVKNPVFVSGPQEGSESSETTCQNTRIFYDRSI